MIDQTNLDKGTDYEKFTQSIYQTLVEADGVENVLVQHNISLRGKSGCNHQIDVYWEFKVAGQIYKTAIECKAFNKTVTIGRVRDFYGVLHDVPGLSGIFATLVGYQSGAKLYADHYGISLKELREPTDADWEGRVKTIKISFHIVSPTITKFHPIITQSFLNKLKPDERIEFQAGFSTHEKIVFDPVGKPTLSYEDIRQGLPCHNISETGMNHRYDLPDHTILLGTKQLPIDGIDVIYDVDVVTENRTVDGGSLVKAIIKDAQSGELKVITKSNEVRHPRN